MDTILENVSLDYNFAADCPIFMKFCMKTQNPRVLMVRWEKFQNLKNLREQKILCGHLF